LGEYAGVEVGHWRWNLLLVTSSVRSPHYDRFVNRPSPEKHDGDAAIDALPSTVDNALDSPDATVPPEEFNRCVVRSPCAAG
ncbi:MAG: hypothetical protein O3A46_12045, partial [Candidatus Poribacteria bacterium]|nr:hypothetical protein [Candidatus Poribacteria bacterium]